MEQTKPRQIYTVEYNGVVHEIEGVNPPTEQDMAQLTQQQNPETMPTKDTSRKIAADDMNRPVAVKDLPWDDFVDQTKENITTIPTILSETKALPEAGQMVGGYVGTQLGTLVGQPIKGGMVGGVTGRIAFQHLKKEFSEDPYTTTLRTIFPTILGGLPKHAEAYSKQDMDDLIEEGQIAITSELLGAGLAKGAKIVARSVPKLARRIGNISTGNIKWLKERGASKIFTPAKESVDYIAKDLVPKSIALFKSKVDDFGLPIQKYLMESKKAPMAMLRFVKSKGLKYVNSLSEQYGGVALDVVDSLKSHLDDAGRLAGEKFDEALANLKDPVLNSRNTVKVIEQILKKNFKIANMDNITQVVKSREVPAIFKVLSEMRDALKYSSGKPRGNYMDLTEFKFYRRLIRDVQRSSKEFAKEGQEVIEAMYKDAERTGAKGIIKAKLQYKQYIEMTKNAKGLLTRNKLSNFFDLPQSEQMKILNLDTFLMKTGATAESMMEDIQAIASQKYLKELTSLTDPDKVFSLLKQGFNEGNSAHIRRKLLKMFGKEANAIMDNLADHRIALGFSTKGISPTSRSGMLAGGMRDLLKEYYEKIYPMATSIASQIPPDAKRILGREFVKQISKVQ